MVGYTAKGTIVGIILDYQRGLNTIVRVVKREVSIKVKFEDGGRSYKPRNPETLEAGKGKGIDSPLEPPEVTQPCRHTDFNPVKPVSGFPIYRTAR